MDALQTGMNIETANDARKELLASDQVDKVIITLTDTGFVLDVWLKPTSKWLPPREVRGIPVRWN